MGAFEGCKGLSGITIPASVKSIGNGTFSRCETLSSVTFEENSKLTSIPDYMFNECKALTGIKLPFGITSIGNGAFKESGLTELEIPASVTNIASTIFSQSTTPKTIYFKGTEEQWENLKVELPKGLTVICMVHTVKFDANGHGAAPADEVIVENGKTIPADKKPADLTEAGYTFKGWYYTENGVEKEFVFGENGTPVTSNMTLKAKWVEKADLTPANLQLNRETQKIETAEGVEGAGDITTRWYAVDKNDQPTGEPLTTLEGAKAGMYQAEAVVAEGDNYKAATLTDTSWRIFVAATLEPSKPIFYDIAVKNGTTNVLSAKKGDLIKLFADEATEGKEFDYWTINGEKIDGDSFEMPAENVVAVAVYKAKTYSVVFFTAHDTAPNSLTVEHGETISGDRILKADGYEFGGWYNGTEKFVFGENGTKVTSNLTMTAKWTEVKKPDPTPTPEPDPEPVTYNIIIDNGTAYLDDGATAINKAEEGQTVTIKVNPEAITEGFEFDQWEIVSGEVKLADETAPETTFEMPASDVELKATVKALEPAVAPLTGIEKAAILTTGTVVAGAGVAAVGFAAYGIGVELYAQALLPAGAALPTNCGELAVLAWTMAGKPQPALPAEGMTDAQTALLWAAESGLLPNQTDTTPENPELPVSARDVVRVLRKARSFAPKR